MSRRGRHLATWVLALSGALAPGAAQAGSDAIARAQKRFDEGMALMRAGKAAEACPKLEESQKLDPGMGTEYRLAECYEQSGRFASASALFGQVAEEARAAGKGDRAALAIKRAADLVPRIPTLTVSVPAAAARVAGLHVLRDGAEIAAAELGKKVPVDPGEHTVRAAAPGKIAWETTVSLKPGAASEVTVPELGAVPPPPPPPKKEAPTPPPKRGLAGTEIAAIVAAGVGLGGLALGGVFGLKAKSQWSDAQAAEKKPDLHQAHLLAASASTSATVSTVGFVAGGAALAGAGVLWLALSPKAPKKSGSGPIQVAPLVGQGTAGALVQGRF